MWLLVLMLCDTPAAMTCQLVAYRVSFFESAQDCSHEARQGLAFFAENGKGGKAACFDVTEIGKNTTTEPSF